MASFLDDLKQVSANLFRRGRKRVDIIAVAIDKRSEMSKAAAAIRKANRERDDLVVEIGKKVYSLHTRGKVTNKDVLGDCEHIDEINAEVAGLRDKIEEIRRGLADKGITVELEDASELSEEAPEEPSEAPEPAADASEDTEQEEAAPDTDEDDDS